jgi:predicted RNase H-like HicB family nuclease
LLALTAKKQEYILKAAFMIIVMRKKYLMTVVIEKDKNGYYAYCPQLQGCYAQGVSYDEAFANIQDAVKLHLEDRKSEHEKVKSPEFVNITSFELAV